MCASLPWASKEDLNSPPFSIFSDKSFTTLSTWSFIDLVNASGLTGQSPLPQLLRNCLRSVGYPRSFTFRQWSSQNACPTSNVSIFFITTQLQSQSLHEDKDGVNQFVIIIMVTIPGTGEFVQTLGMNLERSLATPPDTSAMLKDHINFRYIYKSSSLTRLDKQASTIHLQTTRNHSLSSGKRLKFYDPMLLDGYWRVAILKRKIWNKLGLSCAKLRTAWARFWLVKKLELASWGCKVPAGGFYTEMTLQPPPQTGTLLQI